LKGQALYRIVETAYDDASQGVVITKNWIIELQLYFIRYTGFYGFIYRPAKTILSVYQIYSICSTQMEKIMA
jgi:hypothetical protein